MDSPRIGIWHPGVSSNYGDRAIQLASVQLVLERWPEAEVVQYHDDPDEGKLYYPDPRVSFRPLGPAGLPPLGRSLADLDVLLWGGGSLIQQSSLLHFPWHLLPALAAARKGVRVVCFGSGVEPMRSRLLQALARKVFADTFDDAFVRGPLSAELLASYGAPEAVPHAVDQALILEEGDTSQAATLLREVFDDDDPRPTVSVSVKPAFVYRGGLLPVALDLPSPARVRRRRNRSSFESAFAQLVRHIVEQAGARVLLIPMYLDQGDTDACERVAALAGRNRDIAVLEKPPPPAELKALFGLMEAHVGVRLHSCILATSTGVPTVAIEYMTKHRDYFMQLGMEDLLIAEREVTPDRLIQGFDGMWSDREAIRVQLGARVSLLESELRNVVGRIFDEIDGVR
jgi:polysaccharide pyruvyl transferase WcaK-like protein